MQAGAGVGEPEDSAVGAWSEVRVRLQVWSTELRPAEVSARLGVQPVFSARAGDVFNQRTGATYERHLWQSMTVTGTRGDVEGYVREVLDSLSGCESQLASMADEAGIDIKILLALELDSAGVLHFPCAVLSNDILSRIAAVGAWMDIDLQRI